MLTRGPAQLLRGFCMGTADIVPGVSGGTIALVLGIYEDLVRVVRDGARALARLARLDLRGGFTRLAAVDWGFILPLLVGVAVAIIVLSHTIERLLDERPVEVAAAFFGLVVAAIALTWQQLRQRDAVRLLVFVGAGAATFALLGLRGQPASDPALWFVVVAGAVAICAMILPGISGSLFLLMLGMYDFVLSAVNQRDLLVIGLFAVGAVVGLSVFSSVLDWLLRNHRETVMAALIGLMVGSLRVLWPWPDGTGGTRLAWPAPGDIPVPALLAVAGAVVVLGLAGLSSGRVRAGRTRTSA